MGLSYRQNSGRARKCRTPVLLNQNLLLLKMSPGFLCIQFDKCCSRGVLLNLGNTGITGEEVGALETLLMPGAFPSNPDGTGQWPGHQDFFKLSDGSNVQSRWRITALGFSCTPGTHIPELCFISTPAWGQGLSPVDGMGKGGDPEPLTHLLVLVHRQHCVEREQS